MLIAGRVDTDRRKIEARLARARQEAPITAAWRHYAAWLPANPPAHIEIDRVLPPMTKDLPARVTVPQRSAPQKTRRPERLEPRQ